jgi:hypothetical protein
MQGRVELTFNRERGLRYWSQFYSNSLRWAEEEKSSDSKRRLELEKHCQGVLQKLADLKGIMSELNISEYDEDYEAEDQDVWRFGYRH